MDILPEILSRQSIRAYNKKKVNNKVLERILKAGIHAPSAKNRQEWRFIVVRDKEKKDKIKDAAYGQEHVAQAPVIIAACTTNIDYLMPNGQLSYPIDISFATSYILLQATREGLGSCCITTFDEEKVKYILNIPFSMKVVMLILMGHSDTKPSIKPRNGIKRIVAYEHW